MKDKIEKIRDELLAEFDRRVSELQKEDEWPKVGDEYWLIGSAGDYNCCRFNNDSVDNYHLLQNNIFKTQEECIRYRDIDLKYRQLVRDLNKVSGKVDWKNFKQWKYDCSYNFESNQIQLCQMRTIKEKDVIYCTDPDIDKKAIDLIGQEDLEWYLKR